MCDTIKEPQITIKWELLHSGIRHKIHHFFAISQFSNFSLLINIETSLFYLSITFKKLFWNEKSNIVYFD